MITIQADIDRLLPLVKKIKLASSLQEKISIVSLQPEVKKFLSLPSFLKTMMAGLSLECEYVIKTIIVIHQMDRILDKVKEAEFVSKMRDLLEQLLLVEKFYDSIGGIIGYHLLMLKLLSSHKHDEKNEESYLPAFPIDISIVDQEVREGIRSGLENMNMLAEIYTVGGAADRLANDTFSGKALPAAMMVFERKTLLEWILDDLSAREYLYYKLFHKQLMTPVALMTSGEKDNHSQIHAFIEQENGFKRGKDNFKLFCQPCVPTIDEQGNWGLKGSMHLLLRPGGHGVIWKLAQEEGVFDWFSKRGRKKTLIRQINNVAAGIDHGLLAFTGIGLAQNKKFGFACCTRKEGSTEGMNVVVEKKSKHGFTYSLRCIEYCEEEKYKQIENTLPHDQLYANTNILFADLSAIEDALKKCIIPGVLLNLKPTVFETDEGIRKEQKIGRLESTMQNIADYIEESFTKKMTRQECKDLPTYLTVNRRDKTISAIKKIVSKSSSLMETPEGCFHDLLSNTKELLENECSMKLPEKDFIAFYHPSLGPLYGIIAQKIRKGIIGKGSYLDLQIAELDMENLDLTGTLSIASEDLMGKTDSHGIRKYSEEAGKCHLKNVKVQNLGPDLSHPELFWQKKITHKESCQILLKGNAEFFAEDVVFNGDLTFVVEDGMKLTVTDEDGKLKYHKEKITKPSWYWQYSYNEENEIIIRKMR